MTKIKICGVTRGDDAARIAAAGVEYIGLNFWPRSKRYLAPERAPEIAMRARAAGPAQLVGVFVNASLPEIRAIAQAIALDAIQLHGDETPADVRAVATATATPVWKAIAVGSDADLAELERWGVDVLLLDTPSAGRGGAGTPFDWALARRATDAYPVQRFVLAGGLDPANVAAAIAQVAPFAVDVATGVEAAPGVKDPAKLEAFLAAARGP